MVKRRGTPDSGELVIIRITKVNPHSVNVHLLEYGMDGFIHISEIQSGWVRDIRTHVRVGDVRVAKVIRTDGKDISLSIKRVDKNQENNKLREYKMEQRGEKLLEVAAEQLGKTLEQAYEEIGFTLQDTFGSIYGAFHTAVAKPQQLEEKNLPKQWISAIKEVASKNIELKEFEFQANLFVKTYKPDGINTIKSLLKDAQAKGLEVKYIAAPKYLVSYRTKNAKRGEREFHEMLESIKSKDAETRAEIIKR